MNYEQSDKIYIKNLKIPTILGVHARERKEPRDIILNLTLYIETAGMAKADNIELAMNYEVLYAKLVKYVQTSSFALIESLANAIADLLLDTRGIFACKVVLDKPGALDACESVAVEVFRKS